MLSDKGIDALLTFVDKTDTIIVTRSLTENRMEQLQEMLLEWEAEPTAANERRILDEFAATTAEDKDL